MPRAALLSGTTQRQASRRQAARRTHGDTETAMTTHHCALLYSAAACMSAGGTIRCKRKANAIRRRQRHGSCWRVTGAQLPTRRPPCWMWALQRRLLPAYAPGLATAMPLLTAAPLAKCMPRLALPALLLPW